MKIAHLVSFYNSNGLYRLLFKSLDEHGVEQCLYSPRGIHSEPEVSRPITIRSSELWGKLDRFMFRSKIKKYEKWLERFVGDDRPDVLHAHTLYSDGFAAYRLSKKYNIPYVVTVRSTDLNTFAKYFFHLRPSARKVLGNASRVIFVNNVTQPKLQAYLDFNFDLDSVAIVPNGLNEYWINSAQVREPVGAVDTTRVVCVAKVVKHKNHRNLIESILAINKRGERLYQLTIIGDYSSAFGRKIKDRYESEQIKFAGVLDRQEIRSCLLNSHIFALPSLTETFGIAYLEALSQGLPVLYSKNQGFDGWDSDSRFGISCEPRSIENIGSSLQKLAEREPLSDEVVNEVKERFSWRQVTGGLVSIYTKALAK